MDEGNCPCGHTADLVQRRIVEVDAEIHDLNVLRTNLVRLMQDNDACRTSEVDAWSGQILSSRGGGMHNDLSRLRLYLPLFAMLLLRTTLTK